MSGRKQFKNLRDQVVADPDRRLRVEQYKHAMDDALALAELREGRSLTQVEVAAALDVTQANVSRVEHQDDVYVSTLRGYVAALGGRLELRAIFPDQTVNIDVATPEPV
jgi:DNA-binding XRE family transcriptional regulator